MKIFGVNNTKNISYSHCQTHPKKMHVRIINIIKILK